MVKQMDRYAGMDVELRSSASAAEQLMSSGQIKNAVDETLKMMERERTAKPEKPKGPRIAGAGVLEAYIERRKRLAARIRAENPSCTEEEIEARLEQFGA